MAWNSFGSANSGLQIGTNTGSINNPQFYLPLEPPEPRPEPLSTVPFLHDEDFVNRDALLAQIQEKLSVPGSTTVLVGLGGVGKTRLAIEYCHRVQQQSADTWVFWIHASNTARCENDLRDLADRVKIPGRKDRNTNIFQLVGNWLQDTRVGKWILVLDNVDDDELLSKPLATGTETQADIQGQTQPPLRYLLKSLNGSIIITSRNKAVALDIAGNTKNLINVQPMNQAEALLLLQNKLGIDMNKVDMVQLVKELECMPLAIVQAASYITHRSPRISISLYLEKIRNCDNETTKLLSYEAGRLHHDWEAKNSILLTWQISFDHIRQTRQSAADLLSLMSLHDPQGIPEKLVRIQRRERSENKLSYSELSVNSCADSDFEDDITALRDYSFIQMGEDSTIFSMHRLVQLTVQAWLTKEGEIEQWKHRFISNLCQEFPGGGYENWETCRLLFPHVRSAISHRPETQDSQEKWATLLYRGARYAHENGNTREATEMASKSRKQRVSIFGVSSKEALESTVMLAIAYRREGRWEEAERLEVQVMEMRMTRCGIEHPSTLASMGNLATTYRKQGRWEEAEQLLQQVLKTRKTKFSLKHPGTLAIMGNLATTYRKQGRWDEAERLELQILETRVTKLGDDHLTTLVSMGGLATTYRKQGRWEEAELLLKQVVEMRKIKLGDNHPDTLRSMANLAATYMEQGRCEEAERLQVQVMEMRKTQLGSEHPDTLTSEVDLAVNYREQGKLEEAERLLEQVVVTSQTKLGNDHPDTLRSMANLATTYMDQGRWEEAEQLQVQVTKMRKTKLGSEHPDTLTSMASLALIRKSSGRTSDAIDLLRDCLAKQKHTIGPSHPHTVSNLETLLGWETEHLNIDA